MISARMSACFYVALVALAALGLMGLFYGARLYCDPENDYGFLRDYTGLLRAVCTDKDAFTTVAQVVPATVIAIFVFGLGMVFAVAQMIVPGRGTRSLTVVFRYLRMQTVISFGLVLLAASIGMVGAAPEVDSTQKLKYDADSGTGTLVEPADILREPYLDFAAGLSVATVAYVFLGAGLVISAFISMLDPERFGRRLRNRPWFVAALTWNWNSRQMYESLRIYRGWLRTVNRVGESRDLVFCVEGIADLVTVYGLQVRSIGKRKPALWKEPGTRAKAAALEQKRESERNQLVECHGGDGWPPLWEDVGPSRPEKEHWFADETGRAVVRAVESGLVGGTLPRDLNRMMSIFDDAFAILAPPENEENIDQHLCRDIQVLIDSVSQVAAAVEFCPAEKRAWCASAVLRLARYRQQIEAVSRKTGKDYHTKLSAAALKSMVAGLVSYGGVITPQDANVLTLLVDRCLEIIKMDVSAICNDHLGQFDEKDRPGVAVVRHALTLASVPTRS